MAEPTNEDWQALDETPVASAQVLLMYAPKTVAALHSYFVDQLTGEEEYVELGQDVSEGTRSSGSDLLRSLRNTGEVPAAQESEEDGYAIFRRRYVEPFDPGPDSAA